MSGKQSYYVPASSHWPIVGSIGLFICFLGAAKWLHFVWYGPYLFFTGFLIIVWMMFGWFGSVIQENQQGVYNKKVDRSFRIAMAWFIFSEVCFFAAFFGALFYARFWSVPVLAGSHNPMTHYLLWPGFSNAWPLLKNPDNEQFTGALQAMHAWGLPAINTFILLTSGITITWAHWALKLNQQKQLLIALGLTILLGTLFLGLQGFEYHEAYLHYGLTLNAGIYGSTFFMLTGFHGAHVTIGTIFLIVIWLRCRKGHFNAKNHFGFEACAWYWHFVDVVWLFLFVFVYWL